MVDKRGFLFDPLMQAATVHGKPQMTRDQWVAKFSRISVRSMSAVVPDAESYTLDASWVLARVGGFWRADEEYHVFAMEHAVKGMLDQRDAIPNIAIVMVTPIWVFTREGSKAVPVNDPEVLKVAEANLMRFFEDIHKRWQSNG